MGNIDKEEIEESFQSTVDVLGISPKRLSIDIARMAEIDRLQEGRV